MKIRYFKPYLSSLNPDTKRKININRYKSQLNLTHIGDK